MADGVTGEGGKKNLYIVRPTRHAVARTTHL
jgi:hypothetical protein